MPPAPAPRRRVRMTAEQRREQIVDVATELVARHGFNGLSLQEVADAVGYRAPKGAYETLGGLVMFELGWIPEVGDIVDLPSKPAHGDDPPPIPWRATVVAMDARRVDQVWLTPVDLAAAPTDAARTDSEADDE